MSKNIVVFSDGTGQEGGKAYNTNVYKLFNMIEDRTPRQIAFYDRGLGTGWRKLTGSALGAGISANIRECYEFIFDNYQAGDQIFLFGFSRGAYTVRSLSGFIEMFGILPKSRRELIRQAYKIYKASVDDRDKKKEVFLGKHHTMRCPIRFIGVWDTVAALGIPFKVLDLINPTRNEFHNTEMCKNVEVGRHALAIDDERRAFHPTYWDERRLGQTPDGLQQDMKQVWFSGMHSDVGGGYPEQQLSDIALKWIRREAQASGLLIYGNHKVTIDPDANGKMHDSRDGLGRMYRKKPRRLDERIRKARVHQAVLDRAAGSGNRYQPWILGQAYDIEPL